MTHEIRSNAGAERTRSARGLGWLAGVVLLVSSLGAYGQAPAASGDAAAPLSAEELTKLVGPIALYPDDLVAIVLPAVVVAPILAIERRQSRVGAADLVVAVLVFVLAANGRRGATNAGPVGGLMMVAWSGAGLGAPLLLGTLADARLGLAFALVAGTMGLAAAGIATSRRAARATAAG